MRIYKIAAQFQFITNCTASTSEKIWSMVNHPSAKEIDYDEFVAYVSTDQLQSMFPHYDWNNEEGLELKDDYAVSFYESVYENMACYYVDHSRIEYIFVDFKQIPTISTYQGFSIGDEWIIQDEIVTFFYVDENKKVFVETDHEYWYDFNKEIRK